MSLSDFVIAAKKKDYLIDQSISAGLLVDTEKSIENTGYPQGTQLALKTMFQHTRPKLMCYIQEAGSVSKLIDIISQLTSLEIKDYVVVVLTADRYIPVANEIVDDLSTDRILFTNSIVEPYELHELVKETGVKFDAFIFDSALPAAAFTRWLNCAPTVLSDNSWLMGALSPSRSEISALEIESEKCNLNLTFTGDIWVATLIPCLMPNFQTSITGTAETIRFGSITQSVDEVSEKSVFLDCFKHGISCYQQFGGGRNFDKNLPENIKDKDEIVRSSFKLMNFPPYREPDWTEGHILANIRDVRIAGTKGYSYSRDGLLLEESFGIGTVAVRAIKEIIPPYELIVRKSQTTCEAMQWPGLTAIFPTNIELSSKYVIAMWPDAYIYHHWLVGCLTRFWYLDEFPELASLPIVMNPITRRYQLEYLQMLGLLNNRLVFSNESVSLKIGQSIYPSHFEAPSHSPNSIHWLRDKFLKHAAKLPDGLSTGRYYISRRDGRGRFLINELDVINFLEPFGFKIIEWSAFTVAEQIAISRNAEVIIGSHGSNMSNTVYISPGCKVLEIRPEGYGPQAGDMTLTFATQAVGGKFFSLVCPAPAGRVTVEVDLQVDMIAFKSLFFEMMET